MPPKKGQGKAKLSHPDAEEVTTEGQVNVDVDIHPAPPEEDMPEEAVQPPECRGNLRLVVQPVVAICDWSYNQSWRSGIGRATSRGDLRLVVQSVVRLPMIFLANYSVDGGIAPPVVRPVVKAIVVCARNGR